MEIENFFTKDSYSSSELRQIIEAIPANVFYKDTKCRYQLASHVCKMLNGENDGYTIIGKTDLEIQVEEELGRQYYEEDLDLIANGGEKRYVSEMHFCGDTYYYEISKRAMFDTDGNVSGIVGMVTDMTGLIRLQKELENLSNRDMLTGCYNRTYLERRKLEGVAKDQLPFSLILSDCDGLKKVNDCYGHNMGDEYICKTVTIIDSCMPEQGELIRLGGDEFLILVPNCDASSCAELISRIRDESNRHRVGDCALSSSFGSATILSAQESISAAMNEADASMYDEKKRHREERG